MTVTVRRTCADSLAGPSPGRSVVGGDIRLTAAAGTMLACALRRCCDHHAVCAERVIEVYREAC